jgi:hypothetical protein
VIPGQHVLGFVGFQEAVAVRAPREAWSAGRPRSNRFRMTPCTDRNRWACPADFYPRT